MKKEKILFISAENPFPQDSGGKLRTGNILKLLLAKYDVDLLTYRNQRPDNRHGHVPGLAVHEVERTMSYRKAMLRSLYKWRNCSYLSHADKDMNGRIAVLSKENRYDQVFISHSLLGSCIDIVRSVLPEAVIITDAHNFESSLSAQLAKKKQGVARLYFRLNAMWTREDERKLMDKTSLLLATSEQDGLSFKALSFHNSHKVHVIPNFIRISDYSPKPDSGKEQWIILPGNMNYFPNINAASYFSREIYPLIKAKLPDIKWYIVGRDVHPEVAALAERDPSIVITGYVDSVADYVRRAGVVIVPLLEGSGTRLKILEAWALKTPVVSSTIGAEGLLYEHSKNILIADSPVAFADSVLQLLANREQGRKLADNAYQTLLAHYEAESVKQKLLSLV
ncbi:MULTISPECIES: glycosyltransferase family 4 protein [unclassified Paenibacillus]|uniref:glycosyltransferase family 4 protein n=1 Tax=unclassified Paenibacillus TaxID=185978 RepID=UPI002405B54A|nr:MULTISPECIES: glycosyltransferase family 4 protein [unclassified Paenibacillus]MDF9844012.1 glycosyltransferase involved in cell wall biosynthesis [Paenibacillus sp. PastF-2]MDF9850617.1 glycosyltransferase involved in cell wall biosynthesis [Paenibacillus sp. PastM-2]MDF9857233.1 glycosyltransferase involved in cell wall biosynthesis [Paenibacillus sp. PastF-1]MDH6482467.1 glycosyltransferase involved in cell wall biosynthesis [Paenibacillus sp. PastH-2]MDH6509930.1 glycosyltransferase inv